MGGVLGGKGEGRMLGASRSWARFCGCGCCLPLLDFMRNIQGLIAALIRFIAADFDNDVWWNTDVVHNTALVDGLCWRHQSHIQIVCIQCSDWFD